MAATTGETKTTPTARERLLAAANELFYAEGVHSVGIDRIIERAGVAKASLYNTFGSKDELVRAYLGQRHQARVERVERWIGRYDTPRERLLAVFDALAELAAEPTFRGCAFVNASAEATPGSAAEQMTDQSRTWMRDRFVDLATAAGATDPTGLAGQLILLYDGATLSARLDRDPRAARTARAAAAALLDGAIATTDRART